MADDDLSGVLRDAMGRFYSKYIQLVGRASAVSSSTQIPFWDVVLLTASDHDQAESYRAILQNKLASNMLPSCCEYQVIHDLPGPKIGNGGATLYALNWLTTTYGARLRSLKVLLLNAGGFSKRLPQSSIVGKVFTAIPMGNPVYHMMEEKLIGLIDIPAVMNPGVFSTCADDLIVFDTQGDFRFDQPGFTALGHPSSIEIGTTHGVFVLEDPTLSDKPASLHCVFEKCLEFLHKPSPAKMREHAAVIPGTEMVFSDSSYYFDWDMADRLLAFFHQNSPIMCEIDAYGDFLQALGPLATDQYTRNTANVVAVNDVLTTTRVNLFQHLKNAPLNVILCRKSKFYHIGTLEEYLEHFCNDPVFMHELHFQTVIFSRQVLGEPLNFKNTCLMHSCIGTNVLIGKSSVVEFSDVGDDSIIGQRAILSYVHVPAKTEVPDGVVIQTVPLERGFVSFAFGIADDFKAKFDPSGAAQKLKIYGISIIDVFANIKASHDDIWSTEEKDKGLWTAKLFQRCSSAEASLMSIIALINSARGIKGESVTIPSEAEQAPHSFEFSTIECRMNMVDVMRAKNLPSMLAFAKTLEQKISSIDVASV